MRIFQLIALIISVVVSTTIANAQSSILLESKKIKIEDRFVLYHYVNGNLAQGDTIVIKTPGKLELSSNIPLPRGQYILETPKKIHKGLIEFLIEQNKTGTLTITHDTIYDTVLFKDNPENGIYSAYNGSVRTIEDQIQKLYAKGTAVNCSAAEKEIINNQIKELQRRLYDLENSLIKRYPNTVLSAVIAGNNLPLMPGSILNNYRSDSNGALYKEVTNFLRENYWQGVDMQSDILLNTSLLPSKAKKYISLFDKNDPQLNSIVQELLNKSAVNPSIYQVISEALYTNFSKSVYNDNYESIAVNILKNAQTQSFVPDWKKESITQQINIHQKNMVGSKAANLILKDAADVKHELNELKSKYTILFFYDPECSHCTEIMPKMKGWYFTDGPKDASVMAIYINQNEQEWRKYLKENTYPPRWLNVWDKKGEEKIQEKYWIQNLPAIYVLDENKIVLLKNADFKQLVQYFNNK